MKMDIVVKIDNRYIHDVIITHEIMEYNELHMKRFAMV
jgi:hypothetical protein